MDRPNFVQFMMLYNTCVVILMVMTFELFPFIGAQYSKMRLKQAMNLDARSLLKENVLLLVWLLCTAAKSFLLMFMFLKVRQLRTVPGTKVSEPLHPHVKVHKKVQLHCVPFLVQGFITINGLELTF